jgi:cardiolipin synthase
MLVAVAAFTDWADGFYARRHQQASYFGALFDPIADKVFVSLTTYALALTGVVPLWFFYAMVTRDVLIVMGALGTWLWRLPLTIKPVFSSKVNTFLQLSLVLLGVLPGVGGSLYFSYFYKGLIYATLVTTVLSGGTYARLFIHACQKRS